MDETHIDLIGRNVYWSNFTGEASSPGPTDYNVTGHGSRVAAVAQGTGVAGGTDPGPISFVQNRNLTGFANGAFAVLPFNLPTNPVTVNMTAAWNGASSTTLRLNSYLKGTKFNGSPLFYATNTGTSPLTLSVTLTGDVRRAYTPALSANGSISNFVLTCTISNVPAVGDGFYKFRGVAPGCNWAPPE